MKITAPISKLDEIPLLAEAGANELYCGVVPKEWAERFKSSGVNRRIFGNLDSYDALSQAVTLAHEHDVRLHLVMNGQHYSEPQIGALGQLAERFEAFGGDALIISDVAVLATLAERTSSLSLHVSSVGTVRNSETARLYRDLGADRIIFPRHVPIREMAAMIEAVPELEWEAFILNDGCVYEEGLCHTLHLPGRMGGPICMDRYEFAYERTDGQPLSPDEREAIARNEQDYERWLWYRFGCGFQLTAEGLPYGPCGLCALPQLADAGVGTVKIAGREGASERKRLGVRLVRDALEHFGGIRDAADMLRYGQSLRADTSHCQSGYMCYYPEVLDKGARHRGVRTPALIARG